MNNYELVPIGSYCEPLLQSQYDSLFLPFTTAFVKLPHLSILRPDSCSLSIQNMVLELLPGTDPSRRLGLTPLSWAIEGGHEEIVKMLLERDDTNPNVAHVGGETPLFLAAWKGSEGVVKMLLARKDINPNSANGYGDTPPVFATVWGPWRPHGETAKKTGPDRTTIFTPSRPGTF